MPALICQLAAAWRLFAPSLRHLVRQRLAKRLLVIRHRYASDEEGLRIENNEIEIARAGGQELLLNPERECLRRQFVTGLADIQNEIAPQMAGSLSRAGGSVRRARGETCSMNLWDRAGSEERIQSRERRVLAADVERRHRKLDVQVVNANQLAWNVVTAAVPDHAQTGGQRAESAAQVDRVGRNIRQPEIRARPFGRGRLAGRL